MIRKKLLLGTGCLLSIFTFTTIALTQDERPRNNRPIDPNDSPSSRLETQLRAPQSDSYIYALPAPPDGSPHIRQKRVARTVYEVVNFAVSAEEAKQLQAMQAAKEKLKKAQDEAARKEATDVIEKYLVKQFEEDLAQREKELIEVEERLKTLRQQLDKRKQAKDEIIALRLKTIVNNAEGLGFPGDEDARSGSKDNLSSFAPGTGNFVPTNSQYGPVFEAPGQRR